MVMAVTEEQNVEAGPVSYTHLDVYKRQPEHAGAECGRAVGEEA